MTVSAKTPQTNEDAVYERLRARILGGEELQGEFLRQRDLAARLDTAVVTLRCALRRLENEGLVENVPKWGVRIPVETRKNIQERYFVREALEVAALEQLCERGDPDARDSAHERLMQAAERCDRVAEEDPHNVAEFSTRHLQFHTLIAELSGNDLLVRMLHQVISRSVMLSNARRGWGRGMDRTMHVQLVRRIFTASPGEAAELLREHIRRGLGWELDALNEQTEDEDGRT